MNRHEIKGKSKLGMYCKFSLRTKEREFVLGIGVIYAK